MPAATDASARSPAHAAASRSSDDARRAGCLGAGTVRQLANGARIARLVPTVPARALARHTHDDAHLVFLLRGRYLTCAAGGPPECTAGTLIYSPPATTHRDRFHDLDGGFMTIALPPTLRRPLRGGLDRGPLRAGRRAQAFAQGLALACADWQGDDGVLAETLFDEMLDAIAVPQPVAHGWPAWLARAEAWLHDHADAPADTGALAHACDVHPVHLARVFRRRHGCTPTEYSRRLRLARAASMLRHGHATVASIAVACGFADQAHFHRLFVRAYGMPPTVFRHAR